MPFASPTLADVHTFAYELYFNHFSFQFEKKLEKKSELTQSDTPFLEKWTPLRALEVTQKTWLWQSFFQVYANSHSTSQPLWLLYYEESTSLHAPIRYSTHCLYISISTKMAASHLIFADDARCLCRENMHIVGNLVHNKTALSKSFLTAYHIIIMHLISVEIPSLPYVWPSEVESAMKKILCFFVSDIINEVDFWPFWLMLPGLGPNR